MAGSYADVPGTKFFYDADGSMAFFINNAAAVVALTLAEAQALNDEADGGYTAGNLTGSGVKYGVVFPQSRDLAGYFIAHFGTVFGNAVTIANLQTSADTTNGLDGTWTTRAASPPWSTTVLNSYRTNVTALAVTGIVGVRFAVTCPAGGNALCFGFHFYGSIPAAQTPDRLRLWHPTLDQELGAAALDFGDVLRGSTTDKTFRVKNNSATLTANSVILAASALTDTSPTVVSQLTFSSGGAFASTATITSIAPGAISAVCTARLILTAGAGLSVWRQKITASPTSWS